MYVCTINVGLVLVGWSVCIIKEKYLVLRSSDVVGFHVKRGSGRVVGISLSILCHARRKRCCWCLERFGLDNGNILFRLL